MPKKKEKVKFTEAGPVAEEVTVEVSEESTPVSGSYSEFKALIEEYKKNSPEKYELKRERLEAKLESLK